MKNQKRRQHDAGKTTQGKQSRTRARVDRKCQADETVIKQLTAKQRLEHAQARSLLEYAHLKDECDRLGCSTQEFHRAAVANELARRGAAPMPATQPGLSANEQSGQAKTGKHGASAAAAPQPGGATADDTVIIQITDEQGREQVRVPFSRLEHAELKAECERRGCTMQELFIAALVAGLDKAGHLRASKKGEVAA